MKKEQFITKEYFDKTLDKKLEEHAQVIVTAVGGVLDKRLKNVESDFGIVRSGIADVGGKVERAKDELKKDINDIQILIDGYVKAQEEFKQKFVIVKEEMRQVKEILKEKLGVEVRAI